MPNVYFIAELCSNRTSFIQVLFKMKLLEHVKEGLQNLYFAKLRSSLALLGVLVGTASVVAMVLGGQLATNEALKQFKSLGTDLLAISINSSTEKEQSSDGKAEALTVRQALDIVSIDKNILRVAPYTQFFSNTSFNGNQVNAMILGVTEDFADIVQVKLNAGRFISLVDKYQQYCVVGKNVYNQIKQYSYKEPIGQQIQIGKSIFTIVGVAKDWPENSFLYANVDNSILVPILTTMTLSSYATINNIIVRLAPNTDIDQVQTHLSSALQNLLPDKQISFRSAKELITKMKKQSDILTVFLALIGSISLFVGGIGVMNIMLVSVIERRREIGIRRAVGATRFDIAALFLMEAIMLSLVGGVAGVLIGILIAYLIALFWGWQFTIFWWPPIAGFSVSVAVGIFFGFYPAYLASKLNPIDALRSE